MKKVLCIALALVMVLGFAACGASGGNGGGSSEPEKFKFSRGSWDSSGKVFTNESTGIKITLSGNFEPVSDREVAINYLGSDIDISKWTEADYAKEVNIPDCMFIDRNVGSNCGVLYENLALENAASVTEDQYLLVSLTKIEEQISGVSKGDYYTQKLGGNDFRMVDMSYSMQGLSVKQTMAVRKIGDYMTVIVFTTFDGGEPISAMEGFFE